MSALQHLLVPQRAEATMTEEEEETR